MVSGSHSSGQDDGAGEGGEGEVKDARKGPRRVRGRGRVRVRAGRSVCIYTADSGGVLDWHFQVVWWRLSWQIKATVPGLGVPGEQVVPWNCPTVGQDASDSPPPLPHGVSSL